jgi:hypothetical protein
MTAIHFADIVPALCISQNIKRKHSRRNQNGVLKVFLNYFCFFKKDFLPRLNFHWKWEEMNVSWVESFWWHDLQIVKIHQYLGVKISNNSSLSIKSRQSNTILTFRCLTMSTRKLLQLKCIMFAAILTNIFSNN